MNKNKNITRISLAEARRKIGRSRMMRLASEQKKEMEAPSKKSTKND